MRALDEPERRGALEVETQCGLLGGSSRRVQLERGVYCYCHATAELNTAVMLKASVVNTAADADARGEELR